MLPFGYLKKKEKAMKRGETKDVSKVELAKVHSGLLSKTRSDMSLADKLEGSGRKTA